MVSLFDYSTIFHLFSTTLPIKSFNSGTILIMEFNHRRITVVGSEDGTPSQFVAQVDPIKLGVECEMAITSIHYGEVFNIHKGNNKVYFYYENRSEIEKIKAWKGKSTVLVPSTFSRYTPQNLRSVTIPVGTYTSFLHICWTISNLIRNEVGVLKKKDAMNILIDRQHDTMTIELNTMYLVIEGKSDTPWSLLNVNEDKFNQFTLKNMDLREAVFPAFIYADIIENSYLNGRLTRNLTIVPIKYGAGWTCYEPKYPNYVPITVKQFSKILIELRNIEGDFVNFNPVYKTIITVSIRPIKARETTK